MFYNLVIVIIAAIVSMVIGMAWYSSSMFGSKWMSYLRASGVNLKDPDFKQSMGKIYFLAFVSSLILSYVLANLIILTRASGLFAGAVLGFWIWFGFVATTRFSLVLFERRPMGLYYINVFYDLVSIIVMGAILGVFLS